jgi:hypothetical protein
MPAPTLEGRLLCACGSAYAIVGDETVLAADPGNAYLVGAGFIQPPTVVVGGPDNIDGCLVGQIADGIVLAFRGTLSFDIHRIPNLEDWINDFGASPTPATGFPGSVHSGFLKALQALLPGIADAIVKQRIGPLAEQPVLITGHSKGGAMAGLMAWQLQGIQRTPVKVVTFAAAKPGTAAFQGEYNGQIDHTRYEYGNDIVPHLPPSQDGFLNVLTSLPLVGGRFAGLRRFDYEPVGILRYIDENRQIQGDSPALRAKRSLWLAEEIISGRTAQVFADHAIACGSGYMSAVAPVGVCPQDSM